MIPPSCPSPSALPCDPLALPNASSSSHLFELSDDLVAHQVFDTRARTMLDPDSLTNSISGTVTPSPPVFSVTTDAPTMPEAWRPLHPATNTQLAPPHLPPSHPLSTPA